MIILLEYLKLLGTTPKFSFWELILGNLKITVYSSEKMWRWNVDKNDLMNYDI